MKITRNITDINPEARPHEIEIFSDDDASLAFRCVNPDMSVPEKLSDHRLCWVTEFEGKKYGTMIYVGDPVDLNNITGKAEKIIEVILINAWQRIERLREKELTCLQ